MAKDFWLTVNPMTGKGNTTLTNSGTTHKGRLERQTAVTAVVKGIEAAKSYQVKQEPTAEYITLDKTSFEVGEGASTITVSGKSNSPKITFALGSGNDIPIVLPANYTANGLLTVNGTSIPDDPGAVDEFIFSVKIPIPKNTVGRRTGKITVTGSIASAVGTVTVTQATSTWTVTYSKGDYINTINKASEKINWGNTATAVAKLLANTAQYTYTFLGWYEGDTKISSSLSLSVANITANRTFTAIGSRTLNRYSLAFTITPTGAGTVSGGGTYDYGSSIKSTATTATGYNFTKWVDEEGVSSTKNPHPGWAITKNRTIQAVFTIKSYAINLAAQYRVAESGDFTSGTTGGTVSGGGTFNHGKSVTAKATPATGYSFAGWYEGTSKVSGSASYTFTATGARSLTARFQRQWFTVTFTAGTGGSVSPKTAQVQYGGEASSTATASTGYTFSGWSSGTKTAKLTVTNVTANATYAASFGINTYVITYAKGTGIASVIPASETVEHGSNAKGSTAALTTGYNFDGWYNGDTRVSTALTYGPTNVTGNMTLNATTLRKHVVTVKFVEGNSDSEIVGPIVNRISYSSDAGNGTFETNDEGIAQVSVYLNTPITFSILDNKSYYSVTTSTQSITFTESNTIKTIVAMMIQPIIIRVVYNRDTTIVVDGARVNYNGQTATTNANGVAALYRSGSNVDKNISVSADNYNIFNGVITTETVSPYEVLLQHFSSRATLKVVEMIPDGKGGYIEGGVYANQKLRYRSGSFNYEITTSDEGLCAFNKVSTAQIRFNVVGHPEFYENPENTFAHTDFRINEVTVLQLKCSAKITINVKSNAPSGTNLSGAMVKYFNQTATTDVSGNVSLYRSSVTNTVSATATYHVNYLDSIKSSSASPFNIVMTCFTDGMRVEDG